MTDRVRVCRLAELEDPGAKEFQFADHSPGFVVRKGDGVYGYRNVCPHAGAMLNWGPGKFFTRDGSLIMCAAHGANFVPTSGLCVAGPCKGKSLQPLEVKVFDGEVWASKD